ncbi:MAG: C25 family cysteine peptidase, partial [Candidatus Eisenbacteria bacterium]
MRRASVHPRARLPAFLLAALLVSALRPGAAPAAEEFRLTVTAGGYFLEEAAREEGSFRRVAASFPGRHSEAGRPSLPMRTLLIGVPEGARVAVTVESVESEDLPGDPIEPAGRDTIIGPDRTAVLLPALDEAAYRSPEWYPDPVVSVGAEGRFRHQSVVPIRVHTFQTIPSSGLLRVHKRIDLLVRIEADGGRDGKRSRSEPAPNDPLWEKIYSQTIVNAEAAREHRTRRARPFAPAKRGAAGAEWKVLVAESGIYRIDREDLAAAGFPDGIDVGSISLARRGFSDAELEGGGDPFTESLLPLLVEDNDADGLFGSGDRLYAYLPGFREDRMKRDNDDRFASEAAYFLSTDRGSPSFETRDGWRGYEGLAPLPSFPDSIRWEQDVYYEFKTVAETLDVYYPAGNITDLEMEIDLPPPDTNGTYRIKGLTVGVYYPIEPYHRYVIVNAASGDTVFNELLYGSAAALRWGSGSFPASSLAEGPNRFDYFGTRGTSPATTTTRGAVGFLDWFEVHASFLYAARNDRARFSTGRETGRVEIEASGFGDPDLLLLDVSDPYKPVRVEADSLRFENGAWTVVLQDSIGPPRPYAASTREGARRLGEEKIVRDEPDGRGPLASREADYLIVAHDPLLEAIEPLAEHRESQGLRVARARVGDVYDEFNGGVKDPLALQRYFRYAFERWEIPPAYVLLVGDGYEDFRGIAGNAAAGDSDLVPAYPMFKRGSPSEGNDWVASDVWYVLLDGEADLAPDMLIGRFPASNAAEAAVLVGKTLAYETERTEEPWRMRVALVADDAWVKDSAYPYHNGAQYAFETASLDFARRLSNDAALRADTTNLFLSRFTNIYRSLCPYGDPPNPYYADHACVM